MPSHLLLLLFYRPQSRCVQRDAQVDHQVDVVLRRAEDNRFLLDAQSAKEYFFKKLKI